MTKLTEAVCPTALQQPRKLAAHGFCLTFRARDPDVSSLESDLLVMMNLDGSAA